MSRPLLPSNAKRGLACSLCHSRHCRRHPDGSLQREAGARYDRRPAEARRKASRKISVPYFERGTGLTGPAPRAILPPMLANPPETIAAYIVETPNTLGGRPRIASHRIAVAHVAGWRLRQGMSFEQIAATYDLPLAAVYAAMAYYYEHKAAIDAREAQDLAFAEEMRARTPSKLAAILTA